MNLEQTIAELDNQAAKYTEAAAALRQLLEGEVSLPEVQATRAPVTRKSNKQRVATNDKAANPKPANAKKGKTGRKRVVSAETRAKLAESMRARHQQKREQAAS